MGLTIAGGLALPLDVATQSIGIYGVKGSGKSYAASVLAEEMIEAGVQVAVIDPTDAWWGLRSSADGKGDGYPVYVFGGAHADVPLEGSAGELIADVLVDHGINAILSLRHLRKAEQHRFVTAFCERLYHRKGEPDKRTPLHLFIDEAHAFAPQQVAGDAARMVGAVEDIVRMGRGSGLGGSLISQRPASVNNNVRTQCETLLCLRLLSPHDRRALKDWTDAHDSENRTPEFMASLAALKAGEAWVWSPPLDLFQRVTIRRRRTFDSSATPKPGETRVEPRRLTPVDVEALGARISETVEQAKANDPKALKAEIARLRREAESRPVTEANPEQEERIERLTQERDAMREEANRRGVMLKRAEDTIARIMQAVETHEAINAADLDATAPLARPEPPVRAPVRTAVAPARTTVTQRAPTTGVLTDYQRDILTAVAQRHPAPSTRAQVATLSRKSIRSSMFAPALRALAEAGFTTGTDRIEMTEAGFDVLGGYEAPPTGPALVDWWLARVSPAEATFLRALVDAYPAPLSREEIAARTGRSLTSSQFNPTLRDLVDRELAMEIERGMFRAVDELGA